VHDGRASAPDRQSGRAYRLPCGKVMGKERKERKGKERKVEVSVARYLRTPPKGANPQDLI